MFNQRLKMLREEIGMTQNEVADKIEISPRVYAYYETERFPKCAETIIKLAKLFNCTTDYLLGANDFRNHEDAKNINKSADVLTQIDDPRVLESMKDIFNAMADIGKSADGLVEIANCLKSTTNSLNQISASYHATIDVLKTPLSESLKNLKLLEFKTFSTDEIDSVNASIKKMANELASKLKISFDN